MPRWTPEEEKALEETDGKCCVGCRHTRGRWPHNYAPDHFTKKNKWERYCRYDGEHFGKTLLPSHICDKFKSPFDHSPNNYPIEVSMGGVYYLFKTKEEEQIHYRKWLVEIGVKK